MSSVNSSKYNNDKIYRLLSSINSQNYNEEIISILSESDECPSNDCTHIMTEDSYICNGYDTEQTVLELVNGRIISKTISAKPLVTVEFCEAQGDEGHCKYCSVGGAYSDRYEPEGTLFFCEECGLFIDLSNKKIGYTRDWTL